MLLKVSKWGLFYGVMYSSKGIHRQQNYIGMSVSAITDDEKDTIPGPYCPTVKLICNVTKVFLFVMNGADQCMYISI